MIEKIADFLQSPATAVVVGMVLCVIGFLFLGMYHEAANKDADHRKDKREWLHAMAEKDAEIDKLKRKITKIGSERFAVEQANKILRQQLDYERYCKGQLIKGAAYGSKADDGR
jgi:hypothetical protein